MKSYPSIPHWNKGVFGESVYVFDKLDGSNIRAEWSKKRGWYKFGTKNQLINSMDSQFGEAIVLFKEKYSESLEKVFQDKYRDTQSFIAFFEYFGDKSFAGFHYPNDKKKVVLFDVNQYKRGFIKPKEFISSFGHLDIPKHWLSNYNKELIENIQSQLDSEGVVCKGIRNKQIWMCKIKTRWWLNKLKEGKGEEELLKELNGDKSLL